MLNVFLTVDTEVWQDYKSLPENIESAVYGITPDGEFGLNFLLNRFNSYGLKAFFLLSPYFPGLLARNSFMKLFRL